MIDQYLIILFLTQFEFFFLENNKSEVHPLNKSDWISL